ncbi:MAG: hypothetical protein R2878_00510 [Thermoleophilia bacterium]
MTRDVQITASLHLAFLAVYVWLGVRLVRWARRAHGWPTRRWRCSVCR